MNENKSENFFSIQFVSNMTGINPHTIRAWEKRYGATKPVRDKNGRRLYSNEEVHRLSLLQKLVNHGNNISDIAELSEAELETVLERYKLTSPTSVAQVHKENINTEEILANIKMSLNFFKLDVLAHELQKASVSLTGESFINLIILPTIAEVRVLRTDERLDYSKREQIYLILKSTLVKKMSVNTSLPSDAKRILVASPIGQLNELGAMAAAILFQSLGLQVDFLGGNVSANSVGALNKHFNADFIFLGLNYSNDTILSQVKKEEYLEELAEGVDASTRVLVGAFDFCFKLPTENMQCFSDFKDLGSYFSKNSIQ